MEDIIQLRNVGKKFRIPHRKKTTLFENLFSIVKGDTAHSTELWALKNINLNIKKGEMIGVIGKNGSGKSTLLRIIDKILVPTTGSILVNGTIVPFIDLGGGFQSELTGRENIYLYGSIIGMSEKEISQKYNKIVEFSELADFIDMKLKNYSSGMVARLAFSIGITADVDIMLIDEVLTVGDLSFQNKCLENILELRKAGRTIVFVSHDLETVKKLCNRAILLVNGEVAAEGKSSEVVQRYKEGVSV